MVKKNVLESNARYEKNNCVQFKMKLVKNTDADIIGWLESQSNKQGAVKALIRKEIGQKE